MDLDNVVAAPFDGGDKTFERQVHHSATDELIEDAIRLLSLVEMYGNENEVHGPTVATAVRQVVEVLRKAQEHNREVMPLLQAPWRQKSALT